ncbi:MAG: ABC transporter substrate-binding protein [Armatimonadota bacterium]
MRKGLWILLGLAVAGSLFGNLGSSQAQPAAIKIGATLAVTGPFSAEWGPTFLTFMREWEKVVNEEGGVQVNELGRKVPIQLIIYDDESSPDKSVELYERLGAVDGVHIFLGPSTSPITLRASTVAERMHIPMVAAEANDTALFARNFKWFVGVLERGYDWSEMYFDMVQATNRSGRTNFKTVAVLFSTIAHTRDVGAGVSEYAKKVGLTVVASELVPFPTTDYAAIIAKLRPLNPDVVFMALWGGAEQIAFIRQARELGLRPQEIHSRFVGKPLMTALGAAGVEGITGETQNALKLHDRRMRIIFERMKIDPYDLPWAPIKYVAMDAIVKAIETAGTLRKPVLMEALRDPGFRLQTTTLSGVLRFHWNYRDPERGVLNGFGTQKPFVAQFQEGHLRVVWPERIADAPYKPPRR